MLIHRTRTYRYLRLIVNCVAHWSFQPIPISHKPSYDVKDVTIIVPCLDGDSLQLRQTLKTCLAAQPFELLLVTVNANLERAARLVESLNQKNIRVFSTAHANKRLQLCKAIPHVSTRLTVLADDDVSWPPKIIQWLLAPFEDAYMGAVGTSQRLRRDVPATLAAKIWNFLGAIYLERRNFDISACTYMDGGLPCLSGRTLACRTEILQDCDFVWEFTHETWRSYGLHADDDNFITRWLVSRGWKTHVQYHDEAEVQTTLEDSPKYLKQCLRWSRSNWRSNLTSMFIEKHIWR